MEKAASQIWFSMFLRRLVFIVFLLIGIGTIALPVRAQNSSERLKISEADERVIMNDAHLTRVGGYYKIRGCDDPVSVKLDAVDLNDDGKPEVILTVFDSACFSGLMQSNVSVYVKSSKGKWREVLGFSPAFGVRVQPTRHKGYADLVLTVLGGCDPVYKWSGYSYMHSAKVSSFEQQCGH